jgi:hypothetical protein
MTARDVAGPLPPAKLWKRLPEERKRAAAESFWAAEAPEFLAEAVMAIAKQRNFRPRSVESLPLDKKVRYLAGLPAVADSLAGRLLVAYHLGRQRPMMAAFLDALGIAHEDGLVQEEQAPKPDPERLGVAVERLRGSFPAEDVDLYFATLLWQDPETWDGLSARLSA